MKRYSFVFLLLITSACAPAPQVQYCESQGTPQGSPDYPKCSSYYFQQEAIFRADRAVCEVQADKVYPPSLYSQGTWIMTRDIWGKPDMEPIQPDWQHNHALDELRMSRIIGPCMEAKGWNSGERWTAGRHPIAASSHPAKTHPAQKSSSVPPSPMLPWQ